MTFAYENQGSASFMIYQLAEEEATDEIGLNMIANNKIQGIVPVTFMHIYDRGELRFNISSKITLDSLLGTVLSREKALHIFLSICNILIEAEGYLLEEKFFLFDRRYIFSDVKTGTSYLVYLPVLRDSEVPDLRRFFMELLMSIRSDVIEQTDYIGRILNHLNEPGLFDILSFRSLLEELIRGGNARHKGIMERSDVSGSVQKRGSDSSRRNSAPGSMLPDHEEGSRLAESNASESSPVGKGIRYTRQVNNLNIGSYSPASEEKQRMSSLERHTGDMSGSKDQGLSSDSRKKSFFGMSLNGKSDSRKKTEDEKRQGEGCPISFGEKEKQSAAVSEKYDFVIPGREKQEGLCSAEEYFEKKNNGEKGNNQGRVNQSEKKPPSRNGRLVWMKGEKQEKSEPYPTDAGNRRRESNHGDTGETDLFSYNDYSDDEGGTINMEDIQEEGTTILDESGGGQKKTGGYIPSAYLCRERTGQEIQITGTVFHIGREKTFSNYYIGDNPTVSHSHADILNRSGRYYLIDTNSKNHTYLNGKMLTSNSEYVLQNGDTVMFSNERYEFKIK